MYPSPSPSGVPFCVGAACGRPLRAVFLLGVRTDIIRPPYPASVGADIIRPLFWNRIKFLEVGRGRCLISPLWQVSGKDVGCSPAGGDGDDFALRGDLLCLRRQSRQNATGGRRLEKHSVFLCRLPRTPCFFYGRATKGRGCIHPAWAKDRIPLLAPPAAAPC